jgi:hypothetical protein
MSIFRTIALGAVATAGIVAVTGSVSARVVCNEDGDCWHSQSVEVFPPALGLTIHENNDWKWADGDKHRWHEHEGKGYWKKDKWQDD